MPQVNRAPLRRKEGEDEAELDDVEGLMGGAEQVVLDRNSKLTCLARGGEVAPKAGTEGMACLLELAGVTEPADHTGSSSCDGGRLIGP